MSRRTKTLLPATSKLLQPQASEPSDEREKLVERQNRQKYYFNRTAKDLHPLDKGDVVRMKPLRLGEKKWRKALVIEKRDQRSYTVETADGGVYRRNRVQLRKTQEQPPIIQQHNEPLPLSKPKPSKPTDRSETLPATIPPPEPACESNGSGVNPSPMTLRPARVRRPPERFKDYVCY